MNTGKISFDLPTWLLSVEMLAVVVVVIVCMIRFWRTNNAPRLLRRGLWSLLTVQLLGWAVGTGLLYYSYAHDKLGRYLLPPKNIILIQRSIAGLVTIIAGWVAVLILVLLLSPLFRKKSQTQFMSQKDAAALVLGAAAVGWPGIFLFLVGIFVLAFFGLLFLIIIRRRSMHDRMVVGSYILPSAVITIILNQWLQYWTHLINIRF